VEIEIPAGVVIEEITQDDVPGWDSPSFETSRAFGDRWYDERRTPVLMVPSVATLVERNVLINQDHAAFSLVRASAPLPVLWDARLWKRR
jgi:RES domain-containing protein